MPTATEAAVAKYKKKRTANLNARPAEKALKALVKKAKVKTKPQNLNRDVKDHNYAMHVAHRDDVGLLDLLNGGGRGSEYYADMAKRIRDNLSEAYHILDGAPQVQRNFNMM